MFGYYFFVASALPALRLESPADITFEEFEELLKTNLSAEDYHKVWVIRLFYDIQNIRAFWKKEPLDPHGNWNELELEQALLNKEKFPPYICNLIDTPESIEERLRRFPHLIAAYFQNEILSNKGFLKHYLEFERGWRLVLTGFRAKQLDRDLAKELQFEDPNDDLVAQILAQKDAKHFIVPEDYQELESLFEKYGAAPLKLYQALCAYRFKKVEDLLGVDVFSIDRILGYLVRLIIIDHWNSLDQKKGMDIAMALLHK